MRTPPPGSSGLVTRRRLLLAALAAGAIACGRPTNGAPVSDELQPSAPPGPAVGAAHDEGRLAARPVPPDIAAPPPGQHPLGLVQDRDGLVYLPAGHRPEVPAPLTVLLHGAGAGAQQGLDLMRGVADEHGLVLLAPASRDQRSWDLIVGSLGPDVAFLDRALSWLFRRVAVDPTLLAVGGFSDGASYALSLGLANGDLFGQLIAFSPGFAAAPERVGRPRVFVSHGSDDAVLPIDSTSRRLVPRLRQAGYQVEYREFAGGHAVPPSILSDATAWFLAGR